MDNLFIGVKKFFTNKNTVTIICVVFSLLLLYYVYNWRIKKETQPVVVPYAATSIGPRTYITDDMVKTKKVPGGVVSRNVILNKSEIVGKYINKDAVVPSNGLFYKDAVVSWSDISDALYSNIPNGHTIVNLDVTLNDTYGNSIFPGNYIDLYVKIGQDIDGKKQMTIGKFIESIKVLAVTDSMGNNIFETNAEVQTPKYLVFSVDEDYHVLLKKAKMLNIEIFPVPRNANYSKNPKDTAIVNSKIQDYILKNQITDLSVNTSGGNN